LEIHGSGGMRGVKFKRRWLAAVLGVGVIATAWPALAESASAVVQLFTSQGCSSCPPADRIIAELARDPKLLVLSLPVDYWDYMGWKDTLARPEFTVLQKRYATARGDNHVYTPQAVVDGLLHVVGSNREQILNATRAAFHTRGAMSVSLVLRQDPTGKYVADVGDGQGEVRSGMVWFLRVARHESVSVNEGENRGRVLTYVNVVRSIRPLAMWNGAAKSIDLPPSADLDTDADVFAVLLQAGSQMRPGAILAAAKSPGF
jgi:hypothetical protein